MTKEALQDTVDESIAEPAEVHANEQDHGHDHEHHHDHDHEHDHCHEDGCSCDCDCDCDCAHDDEPPRELKGQPSFSYHVLGIDCPNCARNTQNAVRALSSVEDARLIYATATLDVVAEENVTVDECKRQVLACVRSCGQDLELTDDERARLEAGRPWVVEHREQLLMGLSGGALLLGLITELLVHNQQVSTVFYVIAALAGLAFIAPMAWASLKRRTADMNVLMSIAVIGGLILGFLGDAEVFRDAAIVIFLDQVGEWLEGWSMRKTSGSIKELMDLTPDVAHVVDSYGHTSDVEVAEVEEGQRIRILPGERIPLDGIILKVYASFNEAPVTGESIPQDKGVGQEVYAGTLNTRSVVDIKVTADEDCTTLARIVSMVQGAQAEKAPYESFVDRFAAAYTPVVIVGALIVGILIPLFVSLFTGFRASVWHDWVYRALSLLVVACPCALVISTPVTFVSALTRAAKNGVLVKGGAYFDLATKVHTVAFDKTGTLTTGNPSVTSVSCFSGASERDVLQIAASLEAGGPRRGCPRQGAEHPPGDVRAGGGGACLRHAGHRAGRRVPGGQAWLCALPCPCGRSRRGRGGASGLCGRQRPGGVRRRARGRRHRRCRHAARQRSGSDAGAQGGRRRIDAHADGRQRACRGGHLVQGGGRLLRGRAASGRQGGAHSRCAAQGRGHSHGGRRHQRCPGPGGRRPRHHHGCCGVRHGP